jgi:hypothetical protein
VGEEEAGMKKRQLLTKMRKLARLMRRSVLPPDAKVSVIWVRSRLKHHGLRGDFRVKVILSVSYPKGSGKSWRSYCYDENGRSTQWLEGGPEDAVLAYIELYGKPMLRRDP